VSAGQSCSVSGCSRKHYARGFCATHYKRWRQQNPAPQQANPQGLCEVDGCQRSADARGLCHMHYRRWQKTGDPGPASPMNAAPDNPRGCDVTDCAAPHYCKGFCRSHYAHWRNHGHPTIKPERSFAPCSVSNCPNSAWSQGMCHSHYYANKRTGSPETLGETAGPAASAAVCSVQGCSNVTAARHGLCGGHYKRLLKYGDALGGLRPVRQTVAALVPCSIDGCERPALARGLCSVHYGRFRKFGDPLRIRTMPSRGTGRPIERPPVSVTVRTRCTILGCSHDVWNVQSGLCSRHCGRLRSHGDPGAKVRHRGVSSAGCVVPGCGHTHYGSGYCRRHWNSLVGNKYRRAAEKLAPGHATLQQVAARMEIYGWRCWICGAPFSEVDHVKPIAKGGSNWPSNLRPICLPCNRHKSAAWSGAADSHALSWNVRRTTQ